MRWCRALALVLAMLPLATFASPSAQEGEELSSPASPAAAVAASQRLTFFHMNIAGNVQHAGHTEDIAPAVISSITSSWPSVVSLQEVCEQQFAIILWEVNRLGGRYDARFAPSVESRSGGPCQGRSYGDVLMTRGVNNTWDMRPFQPAMDGENRQLICVNTGFAVRVMACSAHLAPAAQQTKLAVMGWIGRDFLIPFVQVGAPAVFLGDTYLTPDEMTLLTGGLYAHTVRGNTYNNPNCRRLPHTQWDFKCGKWWPTTIQYDYIMVSTNRFSGWSGEVTRTIWSDHLPVRGAATVR